MNMKPMLRAASAYGRCSEIFNSCIIVEKFSFYCLSFLITCCCEKKKSRLMQVTRSFALESKINVANVSINEVCAWNC